MCQLAEMLVWAYLIVGNWGGIRCVGAMVMDEVYENMLEIRLGRK